MPLTVARLQKRFKDFIGEILQERPSLFYLSISKNNQKSSFRLCRLMAQICPRYPRNFSLVTFFVVRVVSAGEHVDMVLSASSPSSSSFQR